MNRKVIYLSCGILISVLASSCLIPLATSWPFESKKGEPNEEVWQESCNPVILLNNGPTCQQINYMIKQHAEEISYLKQLAGEIH